MILFYLLIITLEQVKRTCGWVTVPSVSFVLKEKIENRSVAKVILLPRYAAGSSLSV